MQSDQVSNPELEILFEDLAHPNPYIQGQSGLAMAEKWPKESLPGLMNLLDQDNVSLRRSAVRALGCFGLSILIPLADKFHLSSDATVRASCVKAYAQVASNASRGSLFPKEAMDCLQKALSDQSTVVSLSAVMALGQVGKQGLELLLAVAEGDNPALAVASVSALVQINDPIVEECFAKIYACEQTDSYVRETIYFALERIKG